MTFFFSFEDQLNIDGSVMNQFNAIQGGLNFDAPVLVKIGDDEWPHLSPVAVSKRKQRCERKKKEQKELPERIVQRLEKKKNLYQLHQIRKTKNFARRSERDYGPAIVFDLESTLIPNRFELVVKKFNFVKGQFDEIDRFVLQDSKLNIAKQIKKKICEFSCTFFYKKFKFMSDRALRAYFEKSGKLESRLLHCDFSSIRPFFYRFGFETLWNDLYKSVVYNLRTVCIEVERRIHNYGFNFNLLKFSLKSNTSSYFNSLGFYLRNKIEKKLLEEKRKNLLRERFAQINDDFCNNYRKRKIVRSNERAERVAFINEEKKKKFLEWQSLLFKYEFRQTFFRVVKNFRKSRYLQIKLGRKLALMAEARKKKNSSIVKIFDKVEGIFCESQKKTKIQVLPPRVVWQMDSANVDPTTSTTVTKTSNVVSVDQGAQDKVVTQRQVNYVTRMSEGSQSNIVSEMVERYAPFDQFKWRESDGSGSRRKIYNLPKDLSVNLMNNAPNLLFFKKFKYLSFDMEFKVQLNATRFQVGQMLVAWNYAIGQGILDDISHAIQSPHHILNAPGNNVLTFIIPFKWAYPYWNNGLDWDPIKLAFFVNSALSVPGSASASCNVFIQARLVNVKVAGMRNVEHQMMRSLVRVAEKGLRYLLADPNRDNPTDVTPATAVVPNSSHSWCIGDNSIEVVNVLRLDAVATTPHFETVDEMQVNFVVKHWGALGLQAWRTNQSTGTSILRYQVSPVNVRDARISYPESGRKLPRYGLSPLTRIASMFAYWRGTIEFRFDFVAGMFHTGRVAVCFVPGDSNNSFKADAQSYVEFFDLQDNVSFTYKCPFISDVPWIPTMDPESRLTKSALPPKIGDLIMYVVNPLVAIEGVSDSVTIVPYIRGGPDFEVAVPIFPGSFPSSIGIDYHPSPSAVYVKQGYFQCFTGKWRYTGNGCIVRYGNVTDHIAQFTGGNFNTVYRSEDPAYLKTSATEQIYVNYFARVKVSGQEAYFYMAPFKSYNDALAYVNAADEDKISKMVPYVADSGWYWGHNTVLEPVSSVEHQMMSDAVESALTIEPGPSVNSSAIAFFNESFNDLKSLLRRYSLYCDISVKVPADTPYGGVFYVVPIIPTGLRVHFGNVGPNNKSIEFQSRIRGGVIANVADGYRFWRGGIRMKIIFRNLNGKDLFLQVTHVPDRFVGSLPVSVKPKTALDFIGNGYAYYSQCSRINECMEISVPFYLNADFGLLAHPDDVPQALKLACTSGYLAFSTLSRLEEEYDLTMQVFIAFDDDMRFSSFQGFRLSSSAMELPEQLTSKPLELSQASSSRAPSLEFEMLDLPRVVHQMDRVKEKFSNSIKYVGSLLGEGMSSSGEEMGRSWGQQIRDAGVAVTNDALSKVSEILELIKSMVGSAFETGKHFFISIASQLVHLMHNPSYATFVICCATIWASMLPKDTSYSLFNTFIRFLNHPTVLSIIGMIGGVSFANVVIEQAHQSFRASHQYDSDIVAEFTAMVVTVIASVLGFKMNRKAMANCPNFMHYLLTHIKEITMTGVGLVAFLKLNMKVFGNIVDWLLQTFSGVGLDMLCLTKSATLKTWARAAQQMLDPLHKEAIFSNSVLQRRVFVLVTQGQQMMLADALNGESAQIGQYVKTLLDKLVKLQDELIDNCYCPNARYVPFVMQLVGPPGIGKSELYCELGISMLEAINYVCCGDPIFTKNSGPSYWNGVKQQAILLYDEFGLFRSGTAYEEQIAEFMQIKSSAVFNPSIAELENKKLRYNPLIVLLASNTAFWNDTTVIREPDALHRRRDLLVRCRLKEGVTMAEVREQFVARGYKTYDHLEFAVYNSVIRESDGLGNWMSYASFKDLLIARWKQYHVAELAMYKERLRAMDRLQGPEIPIELEPLEEMVMASALNTTEEMLKEAECDAFRKLVRSRVDTSQMTVLGRDRQILNLQEKLSDCTAGSMNVTNEEWEILHQQLKDLRAKRVADAVAKYGEDYRQVISDRIMAPEPPSREDTIRRAREELAAEQARHQPDDSDSEEVQHQGGLFTDDDSEDDGSFVSAIRERAPQTYSTIAHNKYLKFDKQVYVCPHEEHWNHEWFFMRSDDLGWHWSHPFKSGYLPDLCRGICYFKLSGSESERMKWFKHRYSSVLMAGQWPNANALPHFALQFLPREELEEIHLEDKLDIAIQVGAARATGILERMKTIDWWYWLKKITKWVGVLCTGILAVFGAYKVAKPLFSGGNGDVVEPTTQDPWHEHQYAASGDSRVGRRPSKFATKMNKQSKILRDKVTNHQYDERTPLINLESLIMRNSFQVSLEIDGVRRFRQRGLGICGRKAFTTRHFYEEFKYQIDQKGESKVMLVYEKDSVVLQFTFKELNFIVCEDSSLGILEFSKRLNSFRDIRKHFVSESEVGYLGRHGKFYQYLDGRHQFQNVVFDEYEDLEIGGTESTSDQLLPAVYKYPISGPGKCGSVLYTCSAIPRIIGIHVAGVDGGVFGFAQPILRETFEELKDISVEDPKNIHEFEEIPPAIEPPQGIEVLGTVKKEDAVSIPTKTQIVPSLMYDQICTHETEPAVLRSNDKRCTIDPHIDPVVKAIQTHGLQPQPFDPQILERCVYDMSDYIISTTPKNYLLVSDELTDQEVFSGIAASNIKKLNLNASEGYPLSKIRLNRAPEFKLFEEDKKKKKLPMTGKHWLFKFSETVEGLQLEQIHPILSDLMERNNQLRQMQIAPASIFVDVLKDARVTFDKIEKGKTRMFSMSPIEFTWACKKYFGVFQSAYQAGRIRNGTAIGINVHSVEWSELARQLLVKGHHIVVGDYKSFGDTLARDVMWGAFDVIFNWYSYYFPYTKVQHIRRVLREELFNAPHLVYNLMYRMLCGIPSGFALTVEINDLVNQIYMRYCWCLLTRRPLSEFYRYCKVVTYGDDLILSINSEVIEEFNFETIQKALLGHNISFQPAAKDGSVYKSLNLLEVTFLKCNFVKHHKRLNFFLAKLPLTSCLDMLNWQYKDNDKVTVIFENSRAALMNLYGWGPKIFHHWRRVIMTWISEAVNQGILPSDCLPCHFKSWKEIDDEIFCDSG
nr:MAG: polyprotein [Hubei tick virus 1]